MADFDPDEFLKGGVGTAAPPVPAFDPDAFLAQKEPTSTSFDPDAFLASSSPQSLGGPLSDEDLASASKPVTGGGSPAGDLTQFLKPATGNALSPSVVTAESAEPALGDPMKPLVTLPKPENKGVFSGIVRGTENLAEGLTSPLNLSLLGILPGAPTLIQKGAALGFTAMMAHDLPSKVSGIADSKTPGEAAEKATEAVGEAAMIGFGAKHALGREGAGIRPPSLSPEEANKAALQNQLRSLEPPQTPLTKESQPALPEVVDGLVLAREKLTQGFSNLPEETQRARQDSIDDIDNQLLQISKNDVQASEARVAARGQSTATTTAGEPPVSTGGPSAEGGTSSLFKQAQWEAGATPAEPPGFIDRIKSAYQAVKERVGFPAVPISEVIKESGLPADAVKTYLSDAHDQGDAVLSRGDFSIAGDEERAGSITKGDRENLQVRMPEFDQPHPLDTSEAPAPAGIDPEVAKTYQDSAERIADQVTKGQPTAVRDAARDAAFDNAMSSMKGGKIPSVAFMRKSAREAAGKASAKQGISLDAENEHGTTAGEQQASGESTPLQSAAQADTVKAVQDTVAQLPENLRTTAQAFLENPDDSLRDLADKLGISHQTVANHLKAMQEHFQALKDEGVSLGPGAASLHEKIGNALDPTSLKRAVTDLQRKVEGRSEIDVPERAGSEELINQAEDDLTADPSGGRQLVNRTLKNGVSDQKMSPREAATLLVEMQRLRNERQNLQERINAPETPEVDREAAKTDLADVENQIDRAEQASRISGTAWSDFGRLKQQVIKDDFSLESLERKAITGTGEPLSRQQFKEQFPEQHAKLVELAKQNADLEKQVDDLRVEHDNATQDAEAQRMVEATVNELGKEYLKNPNYSPKVFEVARKVVDRWKSEAEGAGDRIKRALGISGESGGVGGAGGGAGGRKLGQQPVDASVIADIAKVLRAEIGEFGLNKAEALTKLVSEFGEKIRPHFDKAWSQAHQLINSEKAEGTVKAALKEGITKTGEKTEAEAKASAKADAVAGEPLSHKTSYEMVRALIQSGVHGVDALMKAAHEGLKEAYPDLTERDVRRAFSEYGKVKFPSKEALNMELAEARRITQLQESIDRLNEGKDALHTGLQRDKATQQIREKQKELNELLKKREGPHSQAKLASRDEAKQTALKNQIEDLDKQLRTGEKPVKGQPALDSAKTEQLRAERDAMKAKLQEIQDASKPQKSADERYNETRLKQVQKQLSERQAYLEQLKKTGVVPPKPNVAAKVKFSELAKADAELTAKRREIQETIQKIAHDNRSLPIQIKDAAVKTLKLVTSVKVLGHGTVGMFTHAGGLAWRPEVASIFWKNFGRQFKLWTSKAYHDQAIYKLKNDPEFEAWKNAGASIDPEKTYTDYGLYAKWLGKLGEAGGRGFDALKLTRLELNKANWDKVSSAIKNDPVAAGETRKAIADINNKATGAIPRVSPVTPEGSANRITNGVYNLAKNPVADAVFFAPKLYASRWARVVLDPVKTIGTLADWKNASAADKTAAKIRMNNAGMFAATYISALLVNKGLLKASGSDQDVNISDPTRPDWLKFKGAGKEIVADGGLLDPIRLLGQVIVGDILNVRTKNQQYREGTRYQKITEDLVRYARSKFNPTLGLVVDSTTGTDYSGKPLPFSSEPPKYKEQGKYTWPEWLMQQGPIPISQGVKVAYDEMRKNGMTHLQVMQVLKGAAVAAIGGTGIHVTEDHSHKTEPVAAANGHRRR